MKKLLIIPLLYMSILMVSCTSSGYVAQRPNQPVFVQPMSPGPGYIWINGDWVYRGNRYQWHEGYWRRPLVNRQWQNGDWIQQGNRYRWQRGHWSR